MPPSHTVVPLAVLGGFGAASLLYAATIALILRTPLLEKHAVYQHSLTLTEGKDVTKPEQFGFAHLQATSFYIKTKDGAKLHAWHVLPFGLYRRHFAELVIDGQGKAAKFTNTLNFKLLRDDPEARLVIHTHGASGTLTAYCRPEAYRSLSSAAPDKIHVLAFDYRGFGRSTGSPSEEGVLADACAVFKWATETAKIPAERIVIFGQSLGSGVAISLVRELALQKVSVAGLIVTSSFTSVPNLLAEYRVFGLRALGPFAKFPSVVNFLTRPMRSQWPNRDRLVEFIQLSRRFHIEIFHAEDDPIVPWHFSNDFFQHAILAGTGFKLTQAEFDEEKDARTVDMGEGGWYVKWPTSKGHIRQEVLRYGVHDKIMASPQVAMAVARAFQRIHPAFANN